MSEPVGVYAMSITPFDREGAIDEGILRSHLRYLIEGGVGIYACSQGSGEGDLLTFDEKLEVFRIAVDEVAGAVPVCAAGIGLGSSTRQIRDLAVAAEAAGVSAVQVLGPRPGPLMLREDELERYFRVVVEAVSCDVHLSHNTTLAGYQLPLSLLETLITDYPHVVVVNVSELGFAPFLRRVRDLVEGFGDRVEVRVGILSEVVTAHALGARGLLCFEANVAPRLTASVWDAIVRADGARLRDGFSRLTQLQLALTRGGNPRSIKEALRILGRDGGYLREPYLPFQPEQRALLERELEGIARAAGEPLG